MFDRAGHEQPGLEVNTDHNGLYTIYPATNDKLEHLDDGTEASKMFHSRSPTQTLCGLKPLWFGILIGVTTAIVVAAIVGGAVGGAMSHSKGSSSSQNTLAYTESTSAVTPTTTSKSDLASSTTFTTPTTITVDTKAYVPLAPSAVSLLNYSCPTEQYIYQINDNPLPPQTFNWLCETAYLGNDRGDVGITLMQLSAYTAEQCVEACGGLNVWRKELICTAVTFQASMSSEWNVGRGNCWLFNGTNATWDDPGAKTCISAYM